MILLLKHAYFHKIHRPTNWIFRQRATYYRHSMFRTTALAHMRKQISLLSYGQCSGKTKKKLFKKDRPHLPEANVEDS